MTVAGYLLIALLVLWSLYRQLQVNRLNLGTLVRLPVIFLIIGIAVGGEQLAGLFASRILLFTLISVALSLGIGVIRGFQIRIWQDASGWLYKGTWVTVVLWLLMIGAKIGVGFVEGFATQGHSGTPSVGEIFVFIAASFVAQNLILALRTGLWRDAASTLDASNYPGVESPAPRSSYDDPTQGSSFHP